MSKNVEPKIDSEKEPMITELPITKTVDRRQPNADETTPGQVQSRRLCLLPFIAKPSTVALPSLWTSM